MDGGMLGLIFTRNKEAKVKVYTKRGYRKIPKAPKPCKCEILGIFGKCPNCNRENNPISFKGGREYIKCACGVYTKKVDYSALRS